MKKEASDIIAFVRDTYSADAVRRLLDLGPGAWRFDLAEDIMRGLRVILEEKTRDVG